MNLPTPSSPKAFICHASEDKPFAIRLAGDLRENGIDAWLDHWEIQAGDSLRQKIEAAIADTQLFIAIVSPVSLQKPWVNQELDAAFIKKLDGKARIIPVVLGLDSVEIPLFLRTLRYLDSKRNNYFSELLNTCLCINHKPPVTMPDRIRGAQILGLTPSTFDVARAINLGCDFGFVAEKSFGIEELAKATGQSPEDVSVAATELEQFGYVKYGRVMGGWGAILPQNLLFVRTDQLLHGFVPERDAAAVVSVMLNSGGDQFSPEELLDLLKWNCRRLNPALSILMDGKHVLATRCHGSAPFITTAVAVTDRTRLYARRFA